MTAVERRASARFPTRWERFAGAGLALVAVGLTIGALAPTRMTTSRHARVAAETEARIATWAARAREHGRAVAELLAARGTDLGDPSALVQLAAAVDGTARGVQGIQVLSISGDELAGAGPLRLAPAVGTDASPLLVPFGTVRASVTGPLPVVVASAEGLGPAAEMGLAAVAPIRAPDGSVSRILVMLYRAEIVRPQRIGDTMSADAVSIHLLPRQGDATRPMAVGVRTTMHRATALDATIVTQSALSPLERVRTAVLWTAGGAGLLALVLLARVLRAPDAGRPRVPAGGLVLDGVPVGILTIDPAGRVTDLNRAASRLLEVPRTSVLRSPISRWLVAPDDGAPVGSEGWLRDACASRRVRLPDATTRPMQLIPGDDTDGTGHRHVVLVPEADVPSAGDGLTPVVAQELRTPMTQVVALSEQLRATPLSSAQRGYVESLLRASHSMLTFVTDIADLARLQAGTLQLVEAPFSLRALVDEVGTLSAPLADASAAAFVCTVSDGTPDRLIGDVARLRQVLIHLAGNALRHSTGGHVDLAAHGTAAAADVTLEFRVRDTGPGMEPEAVRRLLAEDPSRVSGLAGGGIGLRMVKELVGLMGGHLTIDSLQGEGTTSLVRLRLRLAPGTPAAEATEPRLSGRRALVLSPDADTDPRSGWMRRWGMRVEATASPAEAMARLRDAAHAGDPIAVALVDRQRIGPAADAFARALRADPALLGVGLLVAERDGIHPYESAPSSATERAAGTPSPEHVLRRALVSQAERGGRAPVEGAGSTTLTTAPLMAHRDPAPERPPSARPVQRLRVLVADDNRVHRLVTASLLQQLGCVVESCPDGAEAVRAATREPFALILLDAEMPQLDGLGAARLIRGLPTGSGLAYLIALGTSASPDAQDHYRAAGFDDVIVKPVTPEALDAVLRRLPARPELLLA